VISYAARSDSRWWCWWWILFLQTWRASIIPLLAVPISIIGTFAVMHVFGFFDQRTQSVRTGAGIGIVVDRRPSSWSKNVERNIEGGLSPRDATYSGDARSIGPIHRDRLVLIAVFVPLAFISG